MIIINSYKKIPITPSSKFICKHRYPELRQEIYQAIMNLFNKDQNAKHDGCNNWVLFNDKLPSINSNKFMNLQIHDLNLSKIIMHKIVFEEDLMENANRYLKEIKYAIMLNDTGYLQHIPQGKQLEMQEIIQNLRNKIFECESVTDEAWLYAKHSPILIVTADNIVYSGVYNYNTLAPHTKGLFVYPNNIKYNGQIAHEAPEGNGTVTLACGYSIHGTWRVLNNQLYGQDKKFTYIIYENGHYFKENIKTNISYMYDKNNKLLHTTNPTQEEYVYERGFELDNPYGYKKYIGILSANDNEMIKGEMHFMDESVYIGCFSQNRPCDEIGTIKYINGAKYVGGVTDRKRTYGHIAIDGKICSGEFNHQQKLCNSKKLILEHTNGQIQTLNMEDLWLYGLCKNAINPHGCDITHMTKLLELYKNYTNRHVMIVYGLLIIVQHKNIYTIPISKKNQHEHLGDIVHQSKDTAEKNGFRVYTSKNITYIGNFKNNEIKMGKPLHILLSNKNIYKCTFDIQTKSKDKFLCKLFNQHINPDKYSKQNIIDVIKIAPRGAKVYLKHNEIIVHYTDYEKYVVPTKLTEEDLSLNHQIFHQVNNSGMGNDKNEKIFCPSNGVNFTDNMSEGFVFPGFVSAFKEYLTQAMKNTISLSAN